MGRTRKGPIVFLKYVLYRSLNIDRDGGETASEEDNKGKVIHIEATSGL